MVWYNNISHDTQDKKQSCEKEETPCFSAEDNKHNLEYCL